MFGISLVQIFSPEALKEIWMAAYLIHRVHDDVINTAYYFILLGFRSLFHKMSSEE